MIRKSSSKSNVSIVNSANEEHLTAIKGMDSNTSVVDLSTATLIQNFTVEDSGILKLRNPLIYCDGSEDLIVNTYIFDKNHQLKVSKANDDTILNLYKDSQVIPVEIAYTDLNQKRHTTTNLNFIVDWTKFDIHHTADSSIITGLYVNLNMLENMVDEMVLATSDAERLPRYFTIYYLTERNVWVLEMINPEFNTIVNSDGTIPLDPNLTLDNIYAIRDLYNYGANSVTNIVTYLEKDAIPTSEAEYVETSSNVYSLDLSNGIFGVKLNGTKILIYTKVTLCSYDVSKINTEIPSKEDLSTFFNNVETPDNLTINFSNGDNYDRVEIVSGAIIPAHSRIFDADLGFIPTEISITFNNGDSIYIYEDNIDVQDLSTAQRLVTTQKLYNLAITPAEGDVLVSDLHNIGLDIKFNGNKFCLVKYEPYELSRYVSCQQLSLKPEVEGYIKPLEVSQIYGAFDSQSMFRIKTYTKPSDHTNLINNYTVKELTESVKSKIKFDIVEYVNTKESRPVVLKAFVSTSVEDYLKYYCYWEESIDGGLTWHTAPQFLNKFAGKITYVPVNVLTESNEKLTEADDYVKYVEAVPFCAQSESDLIKNRPDILYIREPNFTYKYRFNIVYLQENYKVTTITVPNIKTEVLSATGISIPKIKNDYILSKIIYKSRIVENDSPEQESFTVKLIFPEDYNHQKSKISIGIKASNDVRHTIYNIESSSDYNLTQNENVYTLHITKNLLSKILTNTEFSHTEVIYFNFYLDGKLINDTSFKVLYYYPVINQENFSYYDTDWYLDGKSTVHPCRANFMPELLCNIFSEKLTLEGSVEKTSTMETLERANVGGLVNGSLNTSYGNIVNPEGTMLDVKHYLDDWLDQETEGSVEKPPHADLMCARDAIVSLKYTLSFTLYNNSNLPKTIQYFISHPKTHVYVDTRAESNKNDTYADVPGTNSGTITINMAEQSYTSAIVKTDTGFKTEFDYESGKTITIPKHASVSGTLTYTLKTKKLEYSYWTSSIAANMFMALFFRTPDGPIAVTSKGYASATPWKNFIWYYYDLPCDNANLEYSATVFSDALYSNSLAEGGIRKFYCLQTLPKIFSKEYTTSTTGIKTAVSVSFKEVKFQTSLEKTSLLKHENIDLFQGKTLYYSNQLLTYNVPRYVNSIYFSNVNSFITPMLNTVDITFGNTITKILPWRNYLIVFTKNTINLVSQDTEYGYTSKLVNTTVGVSKEDSATAIPLLNSIVFKSGNTIYKLVPNLYSAVDTIMNLTDIGSAVSSYIKETKAYKYFAISTENTYYLFCVLENATVVFEYAYIRKTWTSHYYPIPITDYIQLTVDDIRVFSNNKYYYFNQDLKDLVGEEAYNFLPYGDYLHNTPEQLKTYVTANPEVSETDCSSFIFKITFIQKSSNYALDKQFLESKFIFESLTPKATFPVTVDIHTDALLKPIHVDANTDSPLWRIDIKHLGTLNTLFSNNNSLSTSLKQMFIKYAGKGKTISHSISGTSISQFKFYAIDCRSRILPTKQ